MGYVLRVRLASFFAGAATASFIGLSVLYKDYKVAHESISQQVRNRFHFCFFLVSDPFHSIVSLFGKSYFTRKFCLRMA